MKKIQLKSEAYPIINDENYIADVYFTFYDHSGEVPEFPEEPDFKIYNIIVSRDEHGSQEEVKLEDDEFYNMIEQETIIESVYDAIHDYNCEMYKRYEESQNDN